MIDETKGADPQMSSEAPGSLWGARFESAMAPEMVELNQSLPVDSCLWREDIRGSEAWAQALGRAGVLTQSELASVINGLQGVALRIETEGFDQAQEEDIHSVVERMLLEEVGSLGGKLHTGRSRNDQSATGVRLFGMSACDQVRDHLLGLCRALHELARRGLHLPMPGYTHLQQAQPIRAAQWALSHVFAFLRDIERIEVARGAAAVLPLGSGAIAGCPFPIDRKALKDELGFERISSNSVDAVADRDWICDLLYAGAMIGVHMSRLSEDLVLFSSSGFGFVRLSDEFSTGSSLMPQKRNPDVAELARGKSGRLHGNLVTLLTVLKGLPTGYNRDLQEDKEALFDTCTTLDITVPALAGGIRTAEFVPENLEGAIDTQLFATDLADYLVRKGVPFRETHGVVGRLVRLAEGEGIPLSDLSIHAMQNEHEAFDDDVVEVFDWERSTEVRDTIGGTSLRAVQEQLEEVSSQISAMEASTE